jgi:hypothetical protein
LIAKEKQREGIRHNFYLAAQVVEHKREEVAMPPKEIKIHDC